MPSPDLRQAFFSPVKTVVTFFSLATATQYVLGGAPAQPVNDPVAYLQALPADVREVVIEPGVYRLPEKGLLLTEVSDLSIVADGVTFLATNPTGPALTFTHCADITVRGLTIDYDPLPFTQGTITAVDRAARTAEVEIDAGYPVLTELYLVNRMHLFEPDVHQLKPGAPDYYFKRFERISDTRGRIVFRENEPGLDFVEVGDRAAFNPRSESGVKIMEGCRGLRFEDVTIHTSPGLGVIVRFADEAGVFEGLKIVPGPPPAGATAERLLSTCADAFNAAYTRKGPVLDGCEFAYMGDDSLNLHGVVLPVLQWIDERTFLSMRHQANERFDRVIHPGDEVRFLGDRDYGLLATATIESFEIVDEPYSKWRPLALQFWPTFKHSKAATFFRVQLTEPVEGVPVGSISEYLITAASDFVVRDSYFHDHRGRGLRIMAGNGVIENNRFERIKDAGISMGPEFDFWREAGWVKDVTVRGNTFVRVGEGMPAIPEDLYTFGVITVFARATPEGHGTVYYPGNENLLIEGNRIEQSPRDGINISAARDVTVRDNHIEAVNQGDLSAMGESFGLSSGQPITVNQASVLMEDNTIIVNDTL
jgi:hypothetical protein